MTIESFHTTWRRRIGSFLKQWNFSLWLCSYEKKYRVILQNQYMGSPWKRSVLPIVQNRLVHKDLCFSPRWFKDEECYNSSSWRISLLNYPPSFPIETNKKLFPSSSSVETTGPVAWYFLKILNSWLLTSSFLRSVSGAWKSKILWYITIVLTTLCTTAFSVWRSIDHLRDKANLYRYKRWLNRNGSESCRRCSPPGHTRTDYWSCLENVFLMSFLGMNE